MVTRTHVQIGTPGYRRALHHILVQVLSFDPIRSHAAKGEVLLLRVLRNDDRVGERHLFDQLDELEYVSFQLRQICNYDVPDSFWPNHVISMSEEVARPNNLLPRDSVMFFSELRGELCSSFANR